MGGATLAGCFHWHIKDVAIERSYIGIGFGAGNTAVWGSTFEKIEIIDCTGSGIKMWGTLGGPRMLFRDIVVWNPTFTIQPDGAAMTLAGLYAHVIGLEVLRWHNQPIFSGSSIATPFILENVNVEACDWSNGTFVRPFYIIGSAIIRQLQIRGTASAGTTAIVFDGGNTGSFEVDGVEFDITLDGGFSAGFNQCRDLRWRRLIQEQALSVLYYDGDSPKWVAPETSSATIFTKAGAPAKLPTSPIPRTASWPSTRRTTACTFATVASGSTRR